MANPGCGCFCWALPRSLFALFLCWMAKLISGWGICVSPFAVCVCCCLFLCFDLPTYMTTGVHVDVILTCFFSCKDRASERYRPHQKGKKNVTNWCYSYPIDTACPYRHIQNGTSCAEPHDQINCPADIVPSYR